MGKRCRRVLAVLLVLALVAGFAALGGCISFDDGSYPREYSEIVTQEASNNGLEEALVYAVIKAESNFDADAVSRVGAVGLMQLMPETFDWLLMRDGNTELTEDDLTNPSVNIRYGCKYLAFLSELYPAVETVVAAYNAGHGTVSAWLSDAEYSSDGVTLDKIPYSETDAYVNKVMGYYAKYQELYYGTENNEEEA